MQLDQFIRSTLLSIVRGVLEAQDALDRDGLAQVNPEPPRRVSERKPSPVDFDVGVTISSDSKGGGAIGVYALKFGTEIESGQAHTTRIRFTVPLLLPEQPSPSHDSRETHAKQRQDALSRDW